MKNEIRYFDNNNREISIAKDIVNQLKNSSVNDELSYINELIHAVMEIYKNEVYVLDEFRGITNVTDILNSLCDIRLKIIYYQQIEKEDLLEKEIEEIKKKLNDLSNSKELDYKNIGISFHKI